MEAADSEYDLKRSREMVGTLVPVLLDAAGNVIDGVHRLEVDPSWPQITVEEIKSPLDLVRARCAINVCRRDVPPEEKAEWILTAAREMKAAGLEVTLTSIADLIGMSFQWVQKYASEEARILLDEYSSKRAHSRKKALPRRGSAQPASPPEESETPPTSTPSTPLPPPEESVEENGSETGADDVILIPNLGLTLRRPRTVEEAAENTALMLRAAIDKSNEMDPPEEREKRRQSGLQLGTYMALMIGLHKGYIACPHCGRHSLSDLTWGCCHVPVEEGWRPIKERAHIGELRYEG